MDRDRGEGLGFLKGNAELEDSIETRRNLGGGNHHVLAGIIPVQFRTQRG